MPHKTNSSNPGQGTLDENCKIKIEEFAALQVTFKKLNKFIPPEPPIAPPIVDEEQAVMQDRSIIATFIAEQYEKLKAIEVKMLDMPEKDFTEIKFETKIGRMMAFTMTKIRNHVIHKINERAKKLHNFKLQGLDAMLSIDILQERFKL